MAYCINISQNFVKILLNSSLLRGADKGYHTRMILADLQKAFATLHQTAILQVMKSIGFKSFIKQFEYIS